MDSQTLSIEPNELAELYDCFKNYRSILEELIGTDETDLTHGGNHPVNNWFQDVHEKVAGSGWNDAPCYGLQQYKRNEIAIPEYREEYGDGGQVTAFEAISAHRLASGKVAKLQKLDIVSPGQQIWIPVAPESDQALPLFVENQGELRKARELLSEFPNLPAAKKTPAPKKEDLLSIPEIDTEQRLDEMVVRIEEVTPKNDGHHDTRLKVVDPDGNEAPFTIWSKHGVSTDWESGEWYWLQESRSKVWDSSAPSPRELSSTKDMVAVPIGEDLDLRKIAELRGKTSTGDLDTDITTGETRSASDQPATGINSDGENESESSEVVGKLMDDLGLGSS
jgi:hypothetical protein